MGEALPQARQPTVSPGSIFEFHLPRRALGYGRKATHALLAEAAECYDAALMENEELRRRLAEVEADFAQYRESVNEVLVAATRTAESIRHEAALEAEEAVNAARVKASGLLRKAEELSAERAWRARQLDQLLKETRTRLSSFLNETLARLETDLRAEGPRVGDALKALASDLGERLAEPSGDMSHADVNPVAEPGMRDTEVDSKPESVQSQGEVAGQQPALDDALEHAARAMRPSRLRTGG